MTWLPPPLVLLPLALLPSSLSASLVAPGPLLLLVPLASLASLVSLLQVQLARPLRRVRPLLVHCPRRHLPQPYRRPPSALWEGCTRTTQG